MAEYCLRWNNHQPNLVTVFSELLNAETLVDVTLATDGHFIHAHKLVLSACSVYFKDLFGSNPCKHPIVFLKDIKIEDLKTVIDFIYRGEVNVSQERLQDVLKTAESLRIKGLADKPFSYDEYPSQSRSGGQQHLSSSFSSQRSSLTDSREQQQSGDADDLIDVSGGDAHSPPAHKKRKVAASQDSSDGAQETNHEEDRHKSNGKEENAQPQKPPSATPTVNDEGTTTTTPKNSSGSSAKEKQKDEKEVTAVPVASESRPEFQESRAADAMLMLQGSSSDGGEDGGGSGSGGNALSNTSRTGGDSSSLMSSHSQGRGKRGLLQRQPGIIREVATEEPSEEGNASPEYIVPESITLTLATETVVPTISGMTTQLAENTPSTSTVTVTSSKMLQVPAVVVGPHQDKSHYLSLSGNHVQKQSSLSKSLLVVPSSTGCVPQQIMKQRSQPEMSRSYSEGISPQIQIKKEPPSPSHATVLSHAASSVLPDYSSVSSNQQSQQHSLQQQQPMTLYPVQLMKKQKSSPGSLPSTSSTSNLRPIQPKPPNASSDREMPKDLPLIHLTTTDDDVGYQTRFPRAISEEPAISRSLDLLIPHTGAGTLTQSVSQDTGLDGGMAFMNRIMGSQSLTIPKVGTSGGGTSAAGVSSTSTPSSVAHSPVLREGPALGCNYCWNSQDNQGRMQRRKTKYHCPACRTNLCIVPCFHEYHSQMQMQQDQHKQITKILTKTSST
ncbi:UNVERIFIED_CONTAM: hypothetical protein RMT77_013020 [Armadillidium vulgare]